MATGLHKQLHYLDCFQSRRSPFNLVSTLSEQNMLYRSKVLLRVGPAAKRKEHRKMVKMLHLKDHTHLNLKQGNLMRTKIVIANSVDPNEIVHKQLSHLERHSYKTFNVS